MFGQSLDVRDPEQLVFHPQHIEEYNIPQNYGGQLGSQFGVRPQYRDYLCGACGSKTTGRMLCDVKRSDGATVLWCMCACEKKEPTIITEKDGMELMQLPQSRQFHADAAWPVELATLYEEAAKSFAAGAFTSTSLVCRKLLMSCVCHEQEKAKVPVKEGEPFTYYVDYLANTILTFPAAKNAIDAIRKVGNEATHHVEMITRPDAERSLKIIGHLLNTIYSLPAA